MYKLLIHTSAAGDLRVLSSGDRREKVVAARVLALVEQLNTDPPALLNLLDHGYGKLQTEAFDVSKFLEFWKKGKDLWRLKIWDLEYQGLRYRVIYAYVPTSHRFHILAVVHRDFDYDPSHAISQRILQDFDEL